MGSKPLLERPSQIRDSLRPELSGSYHCFGIQVDNPQVQNCPDMQKGYALRSEFNMGGKIKEQT